jgi:glutathione S-transferase
MQLIGMLDSPYVRRVAISLRLLGVDYEHKSISLFRHVDAFSAINPVIKAPSLVADDGQVLMDSTLILDYVEMVAGASLMPPPGPLRTRAVRLLGLALAASEKAVQIVYERNLRPPEAQHAPWLDRVTGQLTAALNALEAEVKASGPWLTGDRMLQPDITTAVTWGFIQMTISDVVEARRYPALAAQAERLEALPAFRATKPEEFIAPTRN